MDCKKIRQLLPSYLEDDLKSGQKKLVEDHLIQCPDCTKIFNSLEETVSSLRSLGEVKTPADFLEGVHRKIEVYEKRVETVFPLSERIYKKLKRFAQELGVPPAEAVYRIVKDGFPVLKYGSPWPIMRFAIKKDYRIIEHKYRRKYMYKMEIPEPAKKPPKLDRKLIIYIPKDIQVEIRRFAQARSIKKHHPLSTTNIIRRLLELSLGLERTESVAEDISLEDWEWMKRDWEARKHIKEWEKKFKT